MENFIIKINGCDIELPYVENPSGDIARSRRSYLTSGIEIVAGLSCCYNYKTLKLVLNGKERFMPNILYYNDKSYYFWDYHTDWVVSLRENGGRIVKKQVPLLVLYNVSPKDILSNEEVAKFHLPEFGHKGRLLTIFRITDYSLDVAFENDLLEKYQQIAVFNEDNAALLMGNEYRFLVNGSNDPVIYFDDGIKHLETLPFVDVTDCWNPIPVTEDVLFQFCDELDLFRIPETAVKFGIRSILAKAVKIVQLCDYYIEAELLPPFATKNGYHFKFRDPNFSDKEFITALPEHVRNLLKEFAPQKFGYLFEFEG